MIEKCLEVVVRLKSEVETDFYIQEIADRLGVSRDALYAEYKKIRSTLSRTPRPTYSKTETPSETKESRYTLPLFHMIAGYIHRYQFLDLFFREFQYTEADLTDIPDSVLLQKLVYGTVDPDDEELLRILDLHLEEEHIHANPELIERAFRDLLRAMHKILLEGEKTKKLSHISPEDPEYLHILSGILAKEKKIGLRR